MVGLYDLQIPITRLSICRTDSGCNRRNNSVSVGCINNLYNKKTVGGVEYE